MGAPSTGSSRPAETLGPELGSEMVSSRLASVAWDFQGAPASRGVHNLHPYPARFIPELPRNLIRLLHPGDESVVFDPFCGSGTTLVEATVAGLPSIGVDVNPVATLIARVKNTPPNCPIEPLAVDLLRETPLPVEVPPIPRVEHWFTPPVLHAVARLAAGISDLEESVAKDALRVALSRIIVRVSNQESDTRYAAIHKSVSAETVYSMFVSSARAVDQALDGHFRALGSGAASRSRVVTQDILTVDPAEIGPVGLVVTSPPYPNAYEYWLYHKYRMYWLGMDPLAVRAAEIGARTHYFKKNHQTECDFERQMLDTFSLVRKVLSSEGYACFVIGRSIIRGREIDNLAILNRAAAANGFRLVGIASREIAPNRKSFNLSHAAIKTEQIAVFQ